MDVNWLQKAVENGAIVVRRPHETSDEFGTVRLATVKTYGDTTHTLVDRSKYKGIFLPGFRRSAFDDPLLKLLWV